MTIVGKPGCPKCKGSGLVPLFTWIPFSDSNSQICECVRKKEKA